MHLPVVFNFYEQYACKLSGFQGSHEISACTHSPGCGNCHLITWVAFANIKYTPCCYISQGILLLLFRLRSTGVPMVDEFSASLLSRMASVPITHNEMLRTQAVSNLMASLARGSPRLREVALEGLASIANNTRAGDASVPISPLKVRSTKGHTFHRSIANSCH